MRRIACRELAPFVAASVLALPLLTAACSTEGDFIIDTMTLSSNPNKPVGDAENMRRVRGADTASAPLTTEPGNIWPSGFEAAPTLTDLESQKNQAAPLGATVPSAGRIPGTAPPGRTPGRQPAGSGAASGAPPSSTPSSAPPSNGILIPNGNGTSTLIHPDGTMTTVPTPK
jgi:hypothetical protein